MNAVWKTPFSRESSFRKNKFSNIEITEPVLVSDSDNQEDGVPKNSNLEKHGKTSGARTTIITTNGSVKKRKQGNSVQEELLQ